MEILFGLLVVLTVLTALNKVLKSVVDVLPKGSSSQVEKFSDPLEKFNRLPVTRAFSENSSDDFDDDFDDFPEVVGESYYSDGFDKVRASLGLGLGEEANVEIELRNDPNNPHSETGTAVGVFVMGNKLGHISRHDSAEVFELLDTWENGGKMKVQGRIYFSEIGRNSLQLIEFPSER